MDANNPDKTSISEPIANKSIIGGSFEIGILNKKEKIEWSKITFDKTQRIILIKTNDGVEIKIKYADIISFIKDESIKIKSLQEENTKLSNSKIKIYLDMRIFELFYFPKFSYKTCSLFGALICKPTETVKKRSLKVIIE